jgi:hypothetical protein
MATMYDMCCTAIMALEQKIQSSAHPQMYVCCHLLSAPVAHTANRGVRGSLWVHV